MEGSKVMSDLWACAWAGDKSADLQEDGDVTLNGDSKRCENR